MIEEAFYALLATMVAFAAWYVGGNRGFVDGFGVGYEEGRSDGYKFGYVAGKIACRARRGGKGGD